MTVRFSVEGWAAWAPGLGDQASWSAWLSDPRTLTGDDVPELAEMAPMARRRLDRLGRAALQVAYWVAPKTTGAPLVFASRYGDIARSVALLGDLARGEPLSPSSFSTSVHNAIAAMFSIARQDRTAYTAVAAGEETVEAAIVEALGYLTEGATEVVVVSYDESLPSPFDAFSSEGEFTRAWACRLVAAPDDGLSLTPMLTAAPAGNADLPADLAALRFLTTDAAEYRNTVGARTWQWQRHA